jgi:hypothetical protein
MNRVLRVVGLVVLGLVVLGFAVNFDLRRTHFIAAAIWGRHTAMAREFFTRAADGDSLALVQLSASSQPVVWALTFGRTEPQLAGSVAHSLRPVRGERRSSNLFIVDYQADARWCPALDEPNFLQLVYTRSGGRWRIEHAGVEPC